MWMYIWCQLSALKLSSGYRKPNQAPSERSMVWMVGGVEDTGTCQAMVWETWEECPVRRGCVMGRPSGISSHQACITIWSDLFRDSHAFKTQQHSRPPPLSMYWWSLRSYWMLICFRSLALFLYDLPSPNNGTLHALNVFKYWFAHHSLQPEERNGKRQAGAFELSYKNTPAERSLTAFKFQ